jgi:hypothetical protein
LQEEAQSAAAFAAVAQGPFAIEQGQWLVKSYVNT